MTEKKRRLSETVEKNKENRMHYLICGLLLIFPAFSNLVTHASSTILTLLLVAGIVMFFSAKDREKIDVLAEEKWMMWAAAAYFGFHFLSFLINGVFLKLWEARVSCIDQEFRIFLFIPVYFILRRVKLPEWVYWYGVSAGAALSGIYALLYSFVVHPGARAAAAYHPIAFGFLSTALAFMSIAGFDFFYRKNRLLSLIPLSAFFFGIAAAVLSGTRGAWLAFPVLLVILFWKIRKKFKPVFFVFIICCFAAGIYKMPEMPFGSRIGLAVSEIKAFSEGEVVWGGAWLRLEMWRVAIDIFKDSPFFGVGQKGYYTCMKQKVENGEIDSQILDLTEPHNEYLSTMVSCGGLGLVSSVALFLAPVYRFCVCLKVTPALRNMAYSGIFLVAGFMHFALTETIFRRNVYTTFYIIMLACVFSMLRQKPQTTNNTCSG